MGDYNAEPYPDIPRAQVLARNYNFLSDDASLTDEWNIDSANRVSSFRDGTKNVQCKIKSDPRNVPLT